MGKVYKDPFIEVNRDKTTVMMSIFQMDYIGELTIQTRSKIQVCCDQRTFLSQIDQADKVSEVGYTFEAVGRYIDDSSERLIVEEYRVSTDLVQSTDSNNRATAFSGAFKDTNQPINASTM